MKKVNAAFAGVAALGLAGAALAAGQTMHVMTVALPGGSVAHIQYAGDVAPKVSVAPARGDAAPAAFLDPFGAFAAFDAAPFADFDRIMADMGRRHDALMRQAAALAQPAGPDGAVNLAAARDLPPGTISYSYVSTSNGTATCGRSVQVVSAGADRKPKTISQTFGDCKDLDAAGAVRATAAPRPPAPPRVTAPPPVSPTT